MSELYQLPDGWEWKKLEAITKLQNGFAFKSDLFTTNGEPIVRIKNIQNEKVVLDDVAYFNPNDYDKNLKTYQIHKNDILIAMSGATTGKIGLYLYDEISYLNQRVGLFRIDNANLRSYLFYFLATQIENNLKQAFGAAQPNLSAEQINNISIPLPPLPEQQRIVAKLNALFEKIDKAIALHVKNMEEADGFMASVLNEVFGELEEKYEKYNLDTIADLIDGDRGSNYPKKDEFFEDEYCLFLNAKNVTKNGFQFTEKQFITKAKDTLLRKGKLKREDLIITTRGTIGNVSIYDNSIEYEQVRINSGMAIIRIKNMDTLWNRFIYKYLFSPQFHDYLDDVQSGSAQPQITIKNLKEAAFSIPPLSVQQKIVAYLDDLSSKIEHVKKVQKEKMESLKALKASILDSAFRGEL